ncbi:MAG: hypothetical protein U0W24_25895 [Bacteroidales bacterium]
MQSKSVLVLIIIAYILSANCHPDKPEGPYDPSKHFSIFRAKIDNIDFEPSQITIFSPDSIIYPMGVFAGNNIHLMNVYFPRDCGEKTFNLPNLDQNSTILFDNIECKTGKLAITKYDVNLVEGTFSFEVKVQDSVLNISNGFFSIVYPIK